MDVEEFILRLK